MTIAVYLLRTKTNFVTECMCTRYWGTRQPEMPNKSLKLLALVINGNHHGV